MTVVSDCTSGSYTPALHFNGTDTFTYSVSDGALSDSAAVTYTVNPVNDAPVVDACNPTSGNPGERLTVEVTGSNFQGGATADFGGRVTVQSVTFVSSSQLDVQIKVHPKAAPDPRTVTVTNPDGQFGTKESCFNVN